MQVAHGAVLAHPGGAECGAWDPLGATVGGLIGLCCSPVIASTPAGSGEAGSVGKDCVWAGGTAAG